MGANRNKRQGTKAYLFAAEDNPPIWLALTDGPTKTFEILALKSDQVLGVGSGVIVFGVDKDIVKKKAEAEGYTFNGITNS